MDYEVPKILETVVACPFNCTLNHSIAALTFTRSRPNPSELIAASAEMKLETVVRARLVVPLVGFQSLRDSLDQVARGLEAELGAREPGSDPRVQTPDRR